MHGVRHFTHDCCDDHCKNSGPPGVSPHASTLGNIHPHLTAPPKYAHTVKTTLRSDQRPASMLLNSNSLSSCLLKHGCCDDCNVGQPTPIQPNCAHTCAHTTVCPHPSNRAHTVRPHPSNQTVHTLSRRRCTATSHHAELINSNSVKLSSSGSTRKYRQSRGRDRGVGGGVSIDAHNHSDLHTLQFLSHSH